MKTSLIQIGNSKGIRIPKTLIEQCQLTGELELVPSNTGLLITSMAKPRQGWEERFKNSIPERQEKDDLAWRSISNRFDNEGWSW